MGCVLGIYRFLSPAMAALAPVAAPLIAPFVPKMRSGLEGRRGLEERLLSAAPRVEGCLWIHAVSVGEYLQGIPLVEAVRGDLADQAPPVVFTHYSPSGREFARRNPCAELHDYLPLDTPGVMGRLIQAWRPRMLVFVKFDIWPNLVLTARRAGVPTLLMAGSLSPRSLRLRWFGRSLFRDVFDRFSHLGVCTEEDRRRFVEDLGVRAPVTVTGDTRIEQVIVRYESSRTGAVSQRLGALPGRRLVLGSTWPVDERLWLPVLAELRRRHPELRIVLCPHEPTPGRLAEIETRLATRGLGSVRLSAFMESSGGDDLGRAAVILVDSVGVLAEIYRAGHLAYVGGSFTTGVHNTMEPAVAGLPVLFGPRIENAEEAGLLVARGAGFVAARPQEALSIASRLLDDVDLLQRAGTEARQVVLDQRGATARSLVLLRRYL